MTAVSVRVQTAPFDACAESAALATLPGVGAVVTFTGVCRDEGGRLAALELEHYPGMAEAEIERIVRQAAKQWPLAAINVVHRHGKIPVGDTIVVVATASSHREAAFEAARFIMDFLKTDAPFWKKEHPAAAGTVKGEWVSATAKDDAARQKWKRA
jgi:molybdopterin synthase catalytic subunit